MNEYNTYIITENPSCLTVADSASNCLTVESSSYVGSYTNVNPYDIRQNINITQDLMYVSDSINSDCETLSDIFEKVFNSRITITNKEIKEENKKMKNCTCTKNWYNEVTKVLFNLSDFEGEDPKPTLTTVVYFSDGSRSVVKNTAIDGIKLVKHDDGTVTPSEDSKELGLMYAVTKRFLGKFDDETGAMVANGYMNKLRKIIRKGVDVNQQKIRRARQKKEAQERHKKMVEDAKARKMENSSFDEYVKLCKKTIETLGQKIQTMKTEFNQD